MRMGEQTHLVFVYGTLRAGFWNRFLLGGAKRAGRGRTSERFALYVGRLPYAIRSEEVHQVVGDLYEVDSRTLTDIDNYKGHPDWYRREMVEVTLEDGTVHSAWMYFYHTRIGKLSPDGAYHPEQPATEAPSRPRFDYLDGFADPPAL